MCRGSAFGAEPAHEAESHTLTQVTELSVFRYNLSHKNKLLLCVYKLLCVKQVIRWLQVNNVDFHTSSDVPFLKRHYRLMKSSIFSFHRLRKCVHSTIQSLNRSRNTGVMFTSLKRFPKSLSFHNKGHQIQS